jgi:hypothetical protein
MQLRSTLFSGLSLLLPSTLATPVPEPARGELGTAKLMPRQAWTVYLFSNSDCNFGGSQGGYSEFGSFGCTNIFSNSVEADTQGCTVTVYGQPGCNDPFHVYTGGDTCFGVVNPLGGSLQSFKVDC